MQRKKFRASHPPFHKMGSFTNASFVESNNELIEEEPDPLSVSISRCDATIMTKSHSNARYEYNDEDNTFAQTQGVLGKENGTLLPNTNFNCGSEDFDDCGEIHFRFLLDSDIPMVKRLCAELFPIEYPDAWYHEITTNPNFFALAATLTLRRSKPSSESVQEENGVFSQSTSSSSTEFIVGMMVAEVKRLNQCNPEDRDILPKNFPANTAVAYILSLGVTRAYRCRGIASRLLDNFLAYLTNGLGTLMGDAKAVYLHVLTTNLDAIRFYEKRHFRRHCKLYDYYVIEKKHKDGYTYVLYVNGGKAPFGLMEACSFLGSLLCVPVRGLQKIVNKCLSWAMTSGSFARKLKNEEL